MGKSSGVVYLRVVDFKVGCLLLRFMFTVLFLMEYF